MRAWLGRLLLRRRLARWREDFEAAGLDVLLESLLRLMALVFQLDRDYRRSIEGFRGRYAFKSGNGRIAASAIFGDGRLKVGCGTIDDANVTVTFRDAQALKGYLFSANPDVIGLILDNSVTYDGNLNYLARFAYLARSLQLKLAL